MIESTRYILIGYIGIEIIVGHTLKSMIAISKRISIMKVTTLSILKPAREPIILKIKIRSY